MKNTSGQIKPVYNYYKNSFNNILDSNINNIVASTININLYLLKQIMSTI